MYNFTNQIEENCLFWTQDFQSKNVNKELAFLIAIVLKEWNVQFSVRVAKARSFYDHKSKPRGEQMTEVLIGKD